MSENNDDHLSSISKSGSPKEIGDYWDAHSLTEHWEQTHEVEFEVRARRRVPLDPEVYEQLAEQARTRGVSLASLVNSWLSERLSSDKAA
jgi:CopG antitoxin of type II toxin-antitoxin system